MQRTTVHILHAQHEGATETLCGALKVPAHRLYNPRDVREALTLADSKRADGSKRFPNIQMCPRCAQDARTAEEATTSAA